MCLRGLYKFGKSPDLTSGSISESTSSPTTAIKSPFKKRVEAMIAF